MKKYLVSIYAEVGHMVGENGGAEGITKVADVFVLGKLAEGEDANTPDVAKQLKNNTGFSYLDNKDDETGADTYTLAFVQGCVVDGEEVDTPEEDIAAAIEDGECIVWYENEDVFVRLDKKQVAKNKLLATQELSAWLYRAEKSLGEVERILKEMLGETEDEEI